MKDGRVQVSQLKREKRRFLRKLQKIVECNDIEDGRVQGLQ